MKTHFKFLAIFLFCHFTNLSLFAQPFSHDTTFQSSYTFRDFYFPEDVGFIGQVIEMEDGSIRVSGGFQDPFDNTYIGNMVKLFPDGQFDANYGIEATDENVFIHLHLPYLYVMSNLGFIKCNHQTLEQDIVFNNNRDSSDWSGGGTGLFILDNGDLLVSSGIFYHNQLPDFRYSFLARIKENGIYDTTFTHDANYHILGMFKYDNDRIMIVGTFTQYDGVPMYRIARIYNDGTLDTTFHSIFTRYDICMISRVIALEDGKMLACGAFNILNFFDKQEYKKQLALVRLLPNGHLDPTFNNFDNAQSKSGLLVGDSAIYDNDYWVRDVLQTSNNKLLIGGNFSYYQGHYRGRIALADENGFLDTTVFTGTGMDTCLGSTVNWFTQVNRIIPAQNDKYYIAGSFSRFNGQMVEPIIRLNPHDHVGIEKVEKEEILQLYPNPAKEKLIINTATKIKNIEIFNLAGVLVQQQTANTKNLIIDVSALPPGNYLLRASGKDDVWVEKFVVIR